MVDDGSVVTVKRRGPVCAYVGLGSNLGERESTLAEACRALRGLSLDRRVECSPLYETRPMGPQDQPDYFNAVCRFQTRLAAEALLDELQRIETAAGRVRGEVRWCERTLDLDLLLYGGERISTARLTVPHAGIAKRLFVLRPLVDLSATVVIPGYGMASELLVQLDGGMA